MSKKMWCAPVLAGLVLLAAAPAQATPLTWTLDNVTFDDGATASGWITYDAADPFSSVFNVSVTAGTVLSAFTFHKDNVNLGDVNDNSYLEAPGTGPNGFFLWEKTPTTLNRTFNFSFANALTDAGGTEALLTTDSYDCTGCIPWRYVTGGSLTTAPVVGTGVPEPATLGLMVPALGMLGWMARRRKQKAA